MEKRINDIVAVRRGDGPYRPPLAEAFRQGARELQIDRLDIPDEALVEEGEGGAFVHCRVYVSDNERLLMDGEEAPASTFTVTGRPLFEIQCVAANKEEAAKRWHEAMGQIANMDEASMLDVAGLEIAFFSDEAEGGEPVSDLYVDMIGGGS